MTKQLEEICEIRDGLPEDVNFILATFLRGLYYGDSWFSHIDKKIFMDNYKHVAQKILATSVVKVACLKEDPNIIVGYSVLSADYEAVVWVFVKSAWRRQGVARSLVPAHPLYVTHLTKLGLQLLPKLSGALFNPFKT